MKWERWFYYVFSLMFILFFILPLINVSLFIFPTGDDFCRSFLSVSNYGNNLKEWYLFHNGRYINALVSLLPVYDLKVYRLVSAIMIFLMGWVIIKFISTLLASYKIKLGAAKEIFLTLLLWVIIIAQLPSLFEMFYWYAGLTAYLFSFIFFLLFLRELLKYYFQKELNLFLLALIIIFLNGNNEILIGITNFLILALLLFDWMREKKWNGKLILLNLISWVSSLALIFAPGTINRREVHEYGGDFFGSLKVALIYGAKFIGTNFFDIQNLVFYVIVFLLVYRAAKNSVKNYINPLILLLISYLSSISLFFIIYYATGLLGVYTGRIGNIVEMVVITFNFINVVNFAIYFRSVRNNSFLTSAYIPVSLGSILVVILLLKNDNYVNVRKDYIENNLDRYAMEMEVRLSLLKETKDKVIYLEPIQNTRILQSGDTYYTGQDWLQDCYLNYINQEYNKNLKSIDILVK